MTGHFLYRLTPVRPAMLAEGPTEHEAEVIRRHFEYLQDLTTRGVVLLAGRTTSPDETGFGVMILRAASEQEARAVTFGDPAVREEVMRAELFPYRVALHSPKGWVDAAASPEASRVKDRQFLIFEQYTVHPGVFLASAPTPLDAIHSFIRERSRDARFEADGSIRIKEGRSDTSYPHALAYVEAEWKQFGEWQIRELPEAASEARLIEAFCGEGPSDVAHHLQACLRLFRRDFPRSRPRGFLW